ncbi:S-adenosylmethionine decarboxylase [Lophiotrema nucula]|uniref:S-adenosylmethionine decarboxylase n=1 Tax=Lophiotrema nucula TaxID=690887 RepID=A0A6A5Z688_9PLEO|nr:S-adenosylmethionine decarboxylase [Lophiotrema nucula]
MCKPPSTHRPPTVIALGQARKYPSPTQNSLRDLKFCDPQRSNPPANTNTPTLEHYPASKGYSSPQTASPPSQPSFHASRGPGTIPVQASKVSPDNTPYAPPSTIHISTHLSRSPRLLDPILPRPTAAGKRQPLHSPPPQMVNTEIPHHYTASPSSHIGTPSLTINKEATIGLDSSNAFEGPEKLLEVWFAASPTELPGQAGPLGLKAVSAETWKEMLDLVNCKVLSVIESEHVDAYLLSESSLFVFPHKIILKTCGTTTLLWGLPRLLEIAALDAGFPHVAAQPLRGVAAAATPYRVFYSRKNFLYPDQQRGPHRSWRDEVRFLDQRFEGGSAYMIGKMNGEHWYLYITGPDTRLTPPPSPDREYPETETKFINYPRRLLPEQASGSEDDETLEVLMTDLDEMNARQFYLEDASAVAEGRFFQKARDARKSAIQSLGAIPEEKCESLGGSTVLNSADNTRPASEDSFDVFEQTSSDHSGFNSDDDLTFPEELTTEGHTLGTVVSETCGLSDVYPTSKYPDARIDAYLFTPCGFSANGVIPAPGGASSKSDACHYFTVHVTPEPQCSYASFETNVPARQTGRETADVIEHVVGIFKPGRFSVTIFEAKRGGEEGLGQGVKKGMRMDAIKGYRRVDRIVHDLDGYDLVFRYYEREDWKGGQPRLGEVGF